MATGTKDISAINKDVGDVTGYWSKRNTNIKKWYNLLLQTDEFAQEDMESFVANCPRTDYNMALYMLQSGLPHRIPTDELEPQEINDSSLVESSVRSGWKENDRRIWQSGRQSFVRKVAGLMLVTGWIAVPYIITDTGYLAEIWNPIQVFPEFDEEFGLVKVVRQYTITAEKVAMMALAKGWSIVGVPQAGDVTVTNYWWKEVNKDKNSIFNCVLAGNTFMKPVTPETDFTEIPVAITPVGGLPDDGAITTAPDARGKQGESVLGTNEQMYRQYNRHWTMSSQILRDSAEPRWFERSQEGNILREDLMFKRGAVFKGGPNDDVIALPMPPIPIELRTDRIDMQNMLQLGGLPWALSGLGAGNMSGYMITQIAEAVQQILKPYHEALIAVMNEVDNQWYRLSVAKHIHPYTDKPLVDNKKFVFDNAYDIRVPGDLVQRATTARMIDPSFRLSHETTMDMFYAAEINNPLRELARVRADIANDSGISILINQIAAYKQNALLLRKNGAPDQATLYEKAAAKLEAQLGLQGTAATTTSTPPSLPQASPTTPTVPVSQSALPREAQPGQASQVPPELMGGM